MHIRVAVVLGSLGVMLWFGDMSSVCQRATYGARLPPPLDDFHGGQRRRMVDLAELPLIKLRRAPGRPDLESPFLLLNRQVDPAAAFAEL